MLSKGGDKVGRLPVSVALRDTVCDIPESIPSFVPRKSTNPFRLPIGSQWLDIRKRYASELQEQRANERQYKVSAKHTFRTRHIGDALPRIKKLLHGYDQEIDEELKNRLDDVEKAYEIAKKSKDKYAYRSKPLQREFVSDIIANKRQLFLAEYVLQTKRQALTKLQCKVKSAEKELTNDEEKLEADAILFDDFLTETDKNAITAMQEAERVTAHRLKLVDIAKKISQRKSSLQSELCRFDEKLYKYLQMKRFLWRIYSDQNPSDVEAKSIIDNTSQMLSFANNPENETLVKKDTADVNTVQKLPYATNEAVLNIITELEDSNLSMIHHFQHSEELVEETRTRNEQRQTSIKQQVKELITHVRHLEDTINEREKRAKELEFVCKMYEVGSYESDAQDKTLAEFCQKIEKVYKCVIGRLEIKIDGLMMLTSIENKLEDLIEEIESFPSDKVRLAQKFKDKQRRLKMREDKLHKQKEKQEERAKRAQERAQAMAFRAKGRRLVFRSDPLKKHDNRDKIQEDAAKDQLDKDEEEFFTW